jgi:hypothetical protein
VTNAHELTRRFALRCAQVDGVQVTIWEAHMPRVRRVTAVVASLVLCLSVLGSAIAGNPNAVPTSISVGLANGFVPVSEVRTAQGAIIDTFQSSAMTIKVLGTPGSSVSFYPMASTADGHGGLGVAMASAASKTSGAADAYTNSGRSVVEDLVSMGVPRADAERDFGGLETPDGTNPYAATAQADAGIVLASANPPPSQPTTVLASPTTPYDDQCITASAENGKLYGYGCSVFYVAHQSGSDWWMATKYLFSAHSTDTSLFPKRLKQVGWKVQWASGNTVTRWKPSNTTIVSGTCVTKSYGLTIWGTGYTESNTLCPDKHGLWELSSLKSGAIWQGAEHDTDWEHTFGVQEVHSPPGAPVSYGSYAMWAY